MIFIFLVFLLLIGGITFIIFSSHTAVKHSACLASSLGVSSLIFGVTIVSIGTDIPEIMNSLISCALGHGNIDVGDSIGSNLTQITLVFGLLPIICGSFIVARKQFLIIGSCGVLSLIFIFTVLEKGYFTRLDALFMILSFLFYLLIIYNVTKRDMMTRVDLMMEESCETISKTRVHCLTYIILGFLAVAFSSFIIVKSIIYLSRELAVNEYIISFFILSIGTSLPELSIDITALRQKRYNIAIGDIVGSCIVDSTISIAIGQFFFPQEVSIQISIPTVLYTICAFLIVVIVVSKRQVMDKKAGILFLAIYLLAIPLLFHLI